jgi:hypothetical protein
VSPRTGLDEVVRRNIPSLYRDILRDFSYFTGPDVRSFQIQTCGAVQTQKLLLSFRNTRLFLIRIHIFAETVNVNAVHSGRTVI